MSTFIDHVKIEIKAGDGGNGAIAFHREKYVSAGGPDGGDGGRGGNIVFRIDEGVNTLLAYRYRHKFVAGNGGDGKGNKIHGASADDLIIPVPRGTIIKDAETGAVIHDMSDGEDFIACRGGRGGWGNRHFATATRQVPMFAKNGTKGEHKFVSLELKMLADVGLIGFPSVGKSSILSRISAARPKIAEQYITVDCGRMWELDDDSMERVSNVIAHELSRMVRRLCGKPLSREFGVLVAGLGNDEITADAIGPETVRRIEVTRHLRTYLPDAYEQIGVCAISALAPGVLGQTGIETVELVRGAAENAEPDVIIAIDALAARSVTRLASTVQLSDAGINPGSGIGNNRRAICRETVGVPVVALGVPTVVDSSTLVYDALERAGVEKVSKQLSEVLEQGKGFFVSPKESDVIVKKVSALLARAIGRAFSLE